MSQNKTSTPNYLAAREAIHALEDRLSTAIEKEELRECLEATATLKSYLLSERRDSAALKYLHDSTAPDGQWADQAVHTFVGAMLKSNAAPQCVMGQTTEMPDEPGNPEPGPAAAARNEQFDKRVSLREACEHAEAMLRNGGTFPIKGQTWRLLYDALQQETESISSGNPRSGYVMLTEEEIERVRSVYKRHFSDGERLDTVCDMAINCLLYAAEINRLREAPSARGEGWNWRLVTQGGFESYRTYLVTDGTSTVTGFHTPQGWVRHDSIDAIWTPTHWQPIPEAPKQ